MEKNLMRDPFMQAETLKQQISAAKGEISAELVLKHAKVINVFTNEIEEADVAIHQGKIVGIGEYSGQTEVELNGKYVCPGLIDGHIEQFCTNVVIDVERAITLGRGHIAENKLGQPLLLALIPNFQHVSHAGI